MAVAVVAAVAVGTAGCATSSTSSPATSSARTSSAAQSSSSSASATSAVCAAADDLRASLDALGRVDVVKQGTDALQQAFARLKADLAGLATTARQQYAGEVQQVSADAAAVQAAIEAARRNTTAQTLGAVAAAVKVLVTDGRALVADLASSC